MYKKWLRSLTRLLARRSFGLSAVDMTPVNLRTTHGNDLNLVHRHASYSCWASCRLRQKSVLSALDSLPVTIHLDLVNYRRINCLPVKQQLDLNGKTKVELSYILKYSFTNLDMSTVKVQAYLFYPLNHYQCVHLSLVIKSSISLAFLSRVSILTHDIDIAKLICLSVCLSVCPSGTFRYQIKNSLTYRHSFFHYTVTQSFQFYQHENTITKFRRVTPCGALNTGGVEKISDFLPISRYISQTIQNIAIVTMEG